MPPSPQHARTQARSRATSEALAVKSISKAKLVCKEDVKDVQAEVAIMNLVGGHPNLVTLNVRGRPHALQGRGACSTRMQHTHAACACSLARLWLSHGAHKRNGARPRPWAVPSMDPAHCQLSA